MQIVKKTYSGIQSLPLDGMLLDKRRVFLCNTITTETANLILKELLFLEDMNHLEPIKLMIDSPGGEIVAGLKLYDQIQAMDTPVDIYCTGMAASMAAIILAGGKKGHRFIVKHSEVMLHEPLISAATGEITGSATSIQKTAESIMKTKKMIVELLAKHTGQSLKKIQRIVSADNCILNAEQAVAFGICDMIVDRV